MVDTTQIIQVEVQASFKDEVTGPADSATEASGKLEDRLHAVGAAATATGQAMAQAASAGVAAGTKALNSMEAAARATAEAVRDGAAQQVTAFDVIAGKTDAVTKAQNRLEGALRTLETAQSSGQKNLNEHKTDQDTYNRVISAYVDIVDKASASLGRAKAAAALNASAIQANADAAAQGTQAINAMAQALTAQAQAASIAAAGIDKAVAALATLARGAPLDATRASFDSTFAASMRYAQSLKQVEIVAEALGLSDDYVTLQQKKLTDAFIEANDPMTTYLGNLKKIADQQANVGNIKTTFNNNRDTALAAVDPQFAATLDYTRALKNLDEVQRVWGLSAEKIAALQDVLRVKFEAAKAAADPETAILAAQAAAQEKAALEAAGLGSALDALRTRYDPLFARSKEYEGLLQELTAANELGYLSNEKYTKSIDQLNTAFANGKPMADSVDVIKQAGISSGQTRFAMQQLGVQSVQLFSSLETGQPIITAFIQQGHQVIDVMVATGTGIGTVIGGLKSFIATIGGWPVVALAAATAGVTLLTLRGADLEAQSRKMQQAIDGVGRSAELSSTQLQKYVTALRNQGVTSADANATVQTLARNPNLSGQQIGAVAQLAPDVAAALGNDAKQAADELAKAIGGDYDAVVSLDNQLGFLTEGQRSSIRTFLEQGDASKAAGIEIDALTARFAGFREKGLTETQRETEALGNTFRTVFDNIGRALSNNLSFGKILQALGAGASGLDSMGGLAPPPLPPKPTIEVGTDEGMAAALKYDQVTEAVRRQLAGIDDLAAAFDKEKQVLAAELPDRVQLKASLDAESEARQKGLRDKAAEEFATLKVAQALAPEIDARKQELAAIDRATAGSLNLGAALDVSRAAGVKATAANEAHEQAATKTGVAEDALAAALVKRAGAAAVAAGGDQVNALRDEVQQTQRLADAADPVARHYADIQNQVEKATVALRAQRDAQTDPLIKQSLTTQIDLIGQLTTAQDRFKQALQTTLAIEANKDQIAILTRQKDLIASNASDQGRIIAQQQELLRLKNSGVDTAQPLSPDQLKQVASAGDLAAAQGATATERRTVALKDELAVMQAGLPVREALRAKLDAERQANEASLSPTEKKAFVETAVATAQRQAADSAIQSASATQRGIGYALALASATDTSRAAAIQVTAANEAHERAATQAGVAVKSLTRELIDNAAAQQLVAGAQQTRDLKDQTEATQRLLEASGPIAEHYAEVNNKVIDLTKNLKAAADATSNPAVRDALLAQIDLTGQLVRQQDDENRALQVKHDLQADQQQLEFLAREKDLVLSNADARARELAQLKEIQKLENEGANRTNFTDAEQAQVRLAGDIADATTLLDRQKSAINELENVASQAFDQVGQAIVNAFVNGNGAAVNFGNIAKSVIASIITEFAKLAILNPILNSLFGGAGTIRPTLADAFGGGVAGGSGIVQNGLAIGNLFSNPTGTISSTIDQFGANQFPGLFSAGYGVPSIEGATSAQIAGATAPNGLFSEQALAGELGTGQATAGFANAGLFNGGSALGGFGSFSNVLGIGGAILPGLLSGNYREAAGGGIGAALGTALFPGVGTILGGLAGNLIGGLFGPGPKNPYTLTDVNVTDQGMLSQGPTFSQVTGSNSDAVAKEIAGLNQVLTSLGLTIANLHGQTPGSVGSEPNNPSHTGTNFIGDTISAAFNRFQFTSASNPELNTYLAGKTFGAPADLQTAVAAFNQAQDAAKAFLTQTVPSLLGSTTQTLAKVQGISDQFAAAAAAAEALKASGYLSPEKIDEITAAEGKLDVARSKAIADAIEPLLRLADLGDGSDQAVNAINDQYNAAIADAKALAESQLVTADQATKLATAEGNLATKRDQAVAAQIKAEQDQAAAQAKAIEDQVSNFSDVAGITSGLDAQVKGIARQYQTGVAAIEAFRKANALSDEQTQRLIQAETDLATARDLATQKAIEAANAQTKQTFAGIESRFDVAAGTLSGNPWQQQAAALKAFDAQAAQERTAYIQQLTDLYGANYQYTADYTYHLGLLTVAQGEERAVLQKQFDDKIAGAVKSINQGYNDLSVRYANAQAAIANNPAQTKAAQLFAFDIQADNQRQALHDQLIAAFGDAYQQTADYAKRTAHLESTLAEERLALIAQTTSQAEQTATGLITNITSFVESLKSPQSNPLSPINQYQQASSQFNAVGGAAVAGDLNSIQQITTYAGNLLNASRAVYGSGQQYVQDYQRVVATLSQIAAESPDQLTASIFTAESRTSTQILKDALDTLAAELRDIKAVLDRNGTAPARAAQAA